MVLKDFLSTVKGNPNPKLNVEGMIKFHESLNMAESKEPNMKLDGQEITEEYAGKHSKTYTGKY